MTTTRNRPAIASSATTTAGMLSSLSHALPNPAGALGRSARALADRLADGRATPADTRLAADMLARLLEETDSGLPSFDADLLDEEFDL